MSNYSDLLLLLLRDLSATAELPVNTVAEHGGQQCWALWAFLAACPCTLFIDVISLFVDWANKDACFGVLEYLSPLGKSDHAIIKLECEVTTSLKLQPVNYNYLR